MNCRICGNNEHNKEYKAQDKWFGDEELFAYFQCSKCACLQIMNYPTNIAKYYPETYYSFQFSSRKKITTLLRNYIVKTRNNYALFHEGILGKLLFSRFPTQTYKILSSLEIDKNMKILDVGCGNGDFLFSLRELGFKNVVGIDPFIEKDLKYENGLHVFKKELSEIEEEYDIVIFKGSFEHMPHPAKVLHAAHRILLSNGYCIIRIPIVSSYAWRHYKENWIQFDAPRHFYLHSVKSIEIVANQAGFDISKVIYDSEALQFWGSEQALQKTPLNDERSYRNNPEKSLFTKNEVATYEKDAIQLNRNKQGDVAIFYLSKQT